MVGMVKAIKATGCDNCSEPKQITRVTRATIISHCRIRMPVEMVMHNLSPNRWEPKAMRDQPAPEEDLFLACLLPFSLPPPFLPFAFFLCRHILPRTCLSHFTSTLSSSVIHPGRTFPGAFLPRPSLQSKPATNPLGAGFNYWLLPLHPALSLLVSQECGGSLVARKSRNVLC